MMNEPLKWRWTFIRAENSILERISSSSIRSYTLKSNDDLSYRALKCENVAENSVKSFSTSL